MIEALRPAEIYNLGAQSHVKVSFDVPEYTAEVDALGTIRLLDAIKDAGIETRFYQASTSEMFGNVQEVPQRETTPFHPRSPYGAAKVYAHWVTVNYREAYDVFASNGILFNHESPRRGETFVTRKITRAIGRIRHGLQDLVYLGNLERQARLGLRTGIRRGDVAHAPARHPGRLRPRHGRTHTVEEFCALSFAKAELPLEFSGTGVDRVGRDENGVVRVQIDPTYYRPTEVDLLLGDPTKAREVLGWEPQTDLETLAAVMVKHDLALAEGETRGKTRRS